jgi:tetratricopeptide (TPR) repeat protein
MSLPLAAKGEFARVQHNMETALDKSGQPVRRGTMAHDHHVYMLLAEAAAQQRDPAALASYAPRLAALAERDGHRLYQGIAARAEGVAQRLAGRHAAATAAFDRALAIFEELGTRWQLGRTLVERAELARLAGDPAAARDLLQRAIQAFEALSAAPDLERAQSALAALPA